MVTSIVIAVSAVGLGIGLPIALVWGLLMLFGVRETSVKNVVIVVASVVGVIFGLFGMLAAQPYSEYYYKDEYDIEQMAIDFKAETKREGNTERLVHEKSLDGEKWIYYLPEDDPFERYKASHIPSA